MNNTHVSDCIHPPFYDGPEDCACIDGIWSQPEGSAFYEAKWEFDPEAPDCRIRQRAWEIQSAEESDEITGR